jgi:hypothetical protein
MGLLELCGRIDISIWRPTRDIVMEMQVEAKRQRRWGGIAAVLAASQPGQ